MPLYQIRKYQFHLTFNKCIFSWESKLIKIMLILLEKQDYASENGPVLECSR